LYCPDCAVLNLTKILSGNGCRISLAPGTREITFFDPSAASSAYSSSQCRVVRRLIQNHAVLDLETSQRLAGTPSRRMQTSEVHGKLSDVFTEKHHILTAKKCWWQHQTDYNMIVTLRTPVSLSRLEGTFHDTARAIVLRLQTT
jgi:hypothetical protein